MSKTTNLNIKQSFTILLPSLFVQGIEEYPPNILSLSFKNKHIVLPLLSHLL